MKLLRIRSYELSILLYTPLSRIESILSRSAAQLLDVVVPNTHSKLSLAGFLGNSLQALYILSSLAIKKYIIRFDLHSNMYRKKKRECGREQIRLGAREG
jgi:hypothetical protein